MPLPSNFSEWEHLQDVVRQVYNRDVRNYFKNQPDNDISTPKARLKHTCIHKDEDTAVMTLTRIILFEVNVGRAQSIQRPVYGIPVQEFQTERRFKPQIKLYFLEPYDDENHASGLNQTEGEITFRLMNFESDTISRADAERFARNIKNTFGRPVFTWKKGWYKTTYFDAARGYDLRLLVKDKAEGERVVRKVLDIQGHPFDRDYFQFVEHDRTYSLSPGTHRVYGQNVKKPIKRRRVDVSFRYAQLHIWGKVNPVNLVASAGSRLRSVIERI